MLVESKNFKDGFPKILNFHRFHTYDKQASNILENSKIVNTSLKEIFTIIPHGVAKFLIDFSEIIYNVDSLIAYGEKNFNSKKYIIELIEKNNYDIVINNKNSYLNLFYDLSKLYPDKIFINIIHQTIVMDIMTYNFLQNYKEHNENLWLFFPSSFTKNLYLNLLTKKTFKYPTNLEVFPTSTIYENPYIDTEKEFDLFTIGRMDKEKNVFELFKKTSNLKYNSTIFSNYNKNDKIEKQIKYFDKNLKLYGDYDKFNIILNLPHQQIMEQIFKYKVYFSTSEMKTLGITVLEAASRGIPSILNCKENSHASESIFNFNEKFYAKINKNTSKNELKEIIEKFYNWNKEQYKELATYIYNHHNKNEWKNKFYNIYNKIKI